MKTIKKYAFILLAALAGVVSQSCQEDIDMSDRYTFTQETIASYLEKHDVYSEYYRILGEVPISRRSKSTVKQLISARGHYTVFAPTNEAIQLYLDSLHRKGVIDAPSWDGFRSEEDKDSIMKVIAYNSIIDSGDGASEVGIYTSSFPKNNEEFEMANMNERRMTIAIDNENNYFINGVKDDKKDSIIGGSLLDARNRDIPAINGVLHQVHTVIAPSSQTLTELLQEFVKKGEEGFIGIANMIAVCGLEKELSKYRDMEYEDLVLTDAIQDFTTPSTVGTVQIPDHKQYGFTIFAESDDFWKGIPTVGDPKTMSKEEFAGKVKDWVVTQGFYPNATNDENYSDPKNVLYQFITYHIIPARIPKNNLVIHGKEYGYNKVSKRIGVPVYDYHVTMGERRLLKFYESRTSDGIYLNRFPQLDNGRDGNNMEIGCTKAKLGFKINDGSLREVINGYIYTITPGYEINPGTGEEGPLTLAYDQRTRENLQRERIRIDFTSLFPELMSNSIRLIPSPRGDKQNWGFPNNNQYKYLENVSIESGTYFSYLPAMNRDLSDKNWSNYQFDEFNVCGSYEITFTLPPVPVKSTYEIRYGVQNDSDRRGMCQVYFGENPNHLPAIGIPLDLRIGGNNPEIIGWEEDVSTDTIANSNVDKRMRNLGFMKGPMCYMSRLNNTARQFKQTTRRIIVRQEMDPNKTYYLKFKSVLEDPKLEFYADYFEFCAKEVYDNPSTPEDIW